MDWSRTELNETFNLGHSIIVLRAISSWTQSAEFGKNGTAKVFELETIYKPLSDWEWLVSLYQSSQLRSEFTRTPGAAKVL